MSGHVTCILCASGSTAGLSFAVPGLFTAVRSTGWTRIHKTTLKFHLFLTYK